MVWYVCIYVHMCIWHVYVLCMCMVCDMCICMACVCVYVYGMYVYGVCYMRAVYSCEYGHVHICAHARGG